MIPWAFGLGMFVTVSCSQWESVDVVHVHARACASSNTAQHRLKEVLPVQLPAHGPCTHTTSHVHTLVHPPAFPHLAGSLHTSKHPRTACHCARNTRTNHSPHARAHTPRTHIQVLITRHASNTLSTRMRHVHINHTFHKPFSNTL